MTLRHDAAGDGPALLLLHSGVCDRRMWDPQWRALAEAGYRVVRCDLRGFGETPAAAGPYSEAADVAGLLDVLGIERAAVVGSSYGGQVAMEFAGRAPERVTALVLLCTAASGAAPTADVARFAAREDALLEAGDIDGAVELNVATWVGPEATEDTRDAVRRMQRRAFEVQLAADASEDEDADEDEDEDPAPSGGIDAALTAPALIVSGGHDLDHFRHIAAGLAARLPAARHVELPWAGHLPSMERPAEITDLLTAFLREAVPAR